MPINANGFNNPAIDMLFIQMSGCAMTPTALVTIKLERILDIYNLDYLNEEDLGNNFTNMHHPPPMVPAGVSVPVQGINVSVKSQKRLIIVSIAARH